MKAAASTRQCFSRARGLAHAGAVQPGLRAHTPARRTIVSHAAPGGAASASQEYREAPVAPSRAKGGDAKLAARRVLHLDRDAKVGAALARLLMPEASAIHVTTVAEARVLLGTEVFSLVVLDPALPDGDPRTLLPLLAGTPLLVYAAHQPEWKGSNAPFLPKPWTSPRTLWVAIAGMLGIPSTASGGD